MGKTDANKSDFGQVLQLLVFKVGSEEYGLDISRVREVIRKSEAIDISDGPSNDNGVITYRGKKIPAIDVRRVFAMNERQDNKDTRIIIVDHKGMPAGLVVDCVNEVIRLPESSPEITTDGNTGSSVYISAVAQFDDRRIFLLDADSFVENALERFPKAPEKTTLRDS